MRAPLQAGDDARRNWKRINELDVDLARALARIKTLEGLGSDLRVERELAPGRMHPFKVYQQRTWLRGGYVANDWRKFRVRAGAVIFDSCTPVNATGTDGSNADADVDVYVGGSDFTVAAGQSSHWVWLELTYASSTWSVAVKNGATPASSGWAEWPALDGRHVPIAKIDTLTKQNLKQAVVRQYLRADVIYGPVLGVCIDDVVQNYVFPAAYKEQAS